MSTDHGDESACEAQEEVAVTTAKYDRAALMDSIRSGNVAVAELHLRKARDENLAQGVFQSHITAALRCAIDENKPEMVKVLLENGCELNVRRADVREIPLLAVTNGRVEILALLLDSGFDVLNDDCLGAAGKSGQPEVMQWLLAKGCNADTYLPQEEYGGPLLHAPAYYGHVDVLKVLLDAGCDKHALDRDKDTALSNAAHSGHLDAVVLLLDMGCDPKVANKDGLTAVEHAARNGHPDIVEVLLNAGCELNTEKINSNILLCRAAAEGCVRVVSELVKKECDVNERQFLAGDTVALHWAAINRHAEVANLLIEAGCNLDKYGKIALHAASHGGSVKIVKMLIDKGCDINSTTCYGLTALHHAVAKSNLDVAKLLLEKGANVNASTIKNLERCNHCGSIESLLDGVAPVNGQAPIHFATEKNDIAMITLLIESGCNINALTEDGRTALNIATEKENVEIINLLSEKGCN